MTNETLKNTVKNEPKGQLSLPRIVTGLKAGQRTAAIPMPPPGV